jgi:adenylosuccinate synthase
VGTGATRKGKVVDALAAEMDLVVRYNGGTNAGHTIVSERGVFRSIWCRQVCFTRT